MVYKPSCAGYVSGYAARAIFTPSGLQRPARRRTMPTAEELVNSPCVTAVKRVCGVALRLLLFPAAALVIGCVLSALTQ